MTFAALPTSSVAPPFAIGPLLLPAMMNVGYPVQPAAALQASSAELGVILPPSLPMILYGVAAEVSIGEMFIAGFGPGLLIGGALILFVYLWCRFTGHGKRDGEGRLELGVALRQASLALLMPVVVLGGIYGGIFTPTEASVVAVFYALIVGMFVYRRISLPDLWRALQRTVVSTTVIMVIIATAGLFAFLITRAGVPAAFGSWVATHLDGPMLFLIGVNVFLFLVGMFIETGAAIVVLAPILVPVAIQFGVDPVHFGIVLVTNLTIAGVTPPVGQMMFISSQVLKVPMDDYTIEVLPFLGAMIVVLVLLTVFPQLTLWLPNLVYGP